MHDIFEVPVDRVRLAVAIIMNEAIARGHKENGPAYTPGCRLLTLLMDINEEVARGINERMNKIYQGEQERAKNQRSGLAVPVGE